MADPSDDESVHEPPAPDVLHAFRAQLTPDFMQDARRYARRRAKLVREVGRRIDPLYHHDLVQDALKDTWSGAARWDPSRQSLLEHVRDLIKQRTFNDRRRARRYRHVSIHAARAANDEISLTNLSIEAVMSEAHSFHGDINPALLSSLLDQVVVELHRLPIRNPDARAVLGCWANGITDGSEVMALTGLSENAYRKARMRILYLAKYLPPELREAAEELLRSAS